MILGLTALTAVGLARAEQTLYGFTGLLQVPTAEVVQHGYMDILLNEDLLNQSHESPSRPAVDHENFALLIGLLPGLEFGAQLAGGSDAVGRSTAGDLSGNVKYSHRITSTLSIAAGLTDFYGSNDGQKFSKATYVVGTFQSKFVSGSLGYADGRNFLDGPFVGIEAPVGKYISVLADYGGQSAQIGVRASIGKDSVGSLYGVYKAAASKFDRRSHGAGGTVNLAANEWFKSAPMFGEFISGLQATKVTDADSARTVQTDSLGYRWSELDAIPEICSRYSDASKSLIRRATRYGIPIYESTVSCKSGTQGGARWSSTTLQDLKTPFSGWSSSPVYLELRVGLEDRSVIGTETGNYEYSDALLSSARLQGPLGLAGYITHELPVANSKDFNETGIFAFQRHDDGIRERALQLAIHPFPGLIAVGTTGQTRVNALAYNFDHIEAAALFWGGLLQVRGTYANYDDYGLGFIDLPRNKLRIANAEVFVPQIASSVEVSYGEFFYRDKGFRLTAARYFGPSVVSLSYRKAEGASPNQIVGLAVAVPFSTRNGLRVGPVSVGGSPYFRYSKGTTLNSGALGNVLRPLLLGEPRPIFNLEDDWLQNSRSYPASINRTSTSE